METEKTNNLFKYWKRIVILICSIITIVLLSASNIDSKGEEVVEESLKEAVIVFGTAKALNAAISLAQGTEVGPPGVTITIGEVLDPINDLVEQFSWIMLASITSLGIQKILMNFVTADIFNVIVILSIALVNIWLFVRFKNDNKARSTFFKITILLIFLRLSIPLMSLINSYTYENFVQEDYNISKSKEIISNSTSNIGSIASETKTEDKGFFDSITKVFDSKYYEQKVKEYKDATEETSNYIVDLIIAFTFRSIIFPLVFLFILYKLSKGLFSRRESKLN